MSDGGFVSAKTVIGRRATSICAPRLFRCGSLECKWCCRKACLTSITERDNAWPRKLIGRLSTARDHSSIRPTSCTQAVSHIVSIATSASPPLGPSVLSRAEFPKGCRQKRPHTLHRIALLWSNLSGVSGGTSSIQRQSTGRPDAGDMGLSTERQCNLRRTRIKPIRTMSL